MRLRYLWRYCDLRYDILVDYLGLYLENMISCFVVLALAIPALTPTRMGWGVYVSLYAGTGTIGEPSHVRYDEATGQQ